MPSAGVQASLPGFETSQSELGRCAARGGRGEVLHVLAAAELEVDGLLVDPERESAFGRPDMRRGLGTRDLGLDLLHLELPEEARIGDVEVAVGEDHQAGLKPTGEPLPDVDHGEDGTGVNRRRLAADGGFDLLALVEVLSVRRPDFLDELLVTERGHGATSCSLPSRS